MLIVASLIIISGCNGTSKSNKATTKNTSVDTLTDSKSADVMELQKVTNQQQRIRPSIR